MKCPYCDNGRSRYSYGLLHRMPCTICDGTGEVQTNEEWFNSLPTNEKAKLFARLDSKPTYTRALTESEWEQWLKEIHIVGSGDIGWW